MSRKGEASPFPNFGEMTTPLDSLDGAPPHFGGRDDPRTPRCRHLWDYKWGEVGERQHYCIHCKRWVWEHAITEPTLEAKLDAQDAARGEVGP